MGLRHPIGKNEHYLPIPRQISSRCRCEDQLYIDRYLYINLPMYSRSKFLWWFASFSQHGWSPLLVGRGHHLIHSNSYHKVHVSFQKRAVKNMALLRKMTCKDRASLPSCTYVSIHPCPWVCLYIQRLQEIYLSIQRPVSIYPCTYVCLFIQLSQAICLSMQRPLSGADAYAYDHIHTFEWLYVCTYVCARVQSRSIRHVRLCRCTCERRWLCVCAATVDSEYVPAETES